MGPRLNIFVAAFFGVLTALGMPLLTETPLRDPSPPHEHVALAAGSCPAFSWHAPGSHDGYADHEHGDQPPDWVMRSSWQPFSQCAEAHQGYKGVLATGQNGTESYIIPHILSTHTARTVRYHGFELWVKDPTGAVSHWGLSGSSNVSHFDMGPAPTQQRCAKSGLRPSMEQDKTGPVDSEAWYPTFDGTTALSVFGYVIYGPNHPMDGTNGEPVCQGMTLGDGSRRNIGWVVKVMADSYGTPAPSLYNYCASGLKGCLLNFSRGSHDWSPDRPMAIPN